jgi:hypothetical protein
MSSFFRVVLNWTGFNGGPGFTNLYFKTAGDTAVLLTDAQNAVTKVDAWATALSNHLPAAVSVRVDPTVTEMNEQTGAQIGFLPTTAPAAHPGGDSSGYSAASGACFNWYTSGALNGRRVRGRTFIVPLGGTKYDSTGTLASTTVTSFQTATQTLLDNNSVSRLQVWHRPSVAAPTSGAAFPVEFYTLPDKAAILTSRRD